MSRRQFSTVATALVLGLTGCHDAGSLNITCSLSCGADGAVPFDGDALPGNRGGDSSTVAPDLGGIDLAGVTLLDGLRLSDGALTPAFSPLVTDYTAEVGVALPSLTVTAI